MAAVRLGAGLGIALAVGAAAGGWWLPAAVGLAGVLVLLAPRAELPSRVAPLADGARLVARLGLVPVFASAVGVYLVPQYRVPVAVGVVVVVTMVDAFGLVLPRFVRGWILGILLLAAAGVIALCLAIAPERGAGQGPAVTGLFAAAAVLVPLLGRPVRWTVGGVMAGAAVCAVALYQLGPVRLGLSDAPLRDLLAAVDGQAIEPLLAGVVVIAAVPAALGALTEARGDLPRPVGSVVCGLLAAAGAALLEPRQAVLVAATLAVAEVLVRSLLTLSARRRDVRSVLSAALAITLLAWLPPVDLLIAVAAIAVGVLLRRPAPSPAR
ncbi:hypothetical protein [Amycolatopsis pithecellobii]|uniref:Uncharacterized protein n=1 Tax=Amycolatopsis pithecellobii TaxID=664692 RepID=A0A6N7Z8W8_9PSEU|nr:hypothetical protein [Amycolatopsis pithecellobii]MTD58280.1 hypothetical protein [Amycolatopsis pithecellobii]